MILANAINAPYQVMQTFTPTVSGDGTAGSGTYTQQTGFWGQIGDIITCSMTVIWTNHTGTGNLLITDLPFACHNTANYDPEAVLVTQNITLPGTTVSVLGHLESGTTSIACATIRNNGTLLPIALPTSGEVHCTVTYMK